MESMYDVGYSGGIVVVIDGFVDVGGIGCFGDGCGGGTRTGSSSCCCCYEATSFDGN